MIHGYVVNNLGRGKHIFKLSVTPGMKVPLKQLYKMYKNKYGGKFDTEFLEWLEKTKIPKGCGFDIVVKSIEDKDVVKDETEPTQERVMEKPKRFSGRKLTARQISELKIKDNPKALIKEVQSIHKLRRALNFCKGRSGKETLSRLIRDRLTELS